MRILCIGAHPDDCELQFAGTAAKFAAAGSSVKFLSITSGNAGHHILDRVTLAATRRRETVLAAQRLGIAETEILGIDDGHVLPALEIRDKIVRQIRNWEADIVLTHRPNDYHPDHRYTSQLVQDSAYLVVVPHLYTGSRPLRRNPIFIYLEDAFQLPNPFVADIAVNIDDVWQTKLQALDAHASQVYEWLPWVDGIEDIERSTSWLETRYARPISPATRLALSRRYHDSESILYAEAFQVCEYGRRPTAKELDALFPR
jgi:LmbE family N-acetylglucosaminyl deacetylase